MEYTRRNFLRTLGKSLAGIAIASTIPTIAEAKQGRIYMPKFARVRLDQSIIPGGSFSWGEATKNGQRVPNNSEIVNSIVKSARYMQGVREYFGNRPIRVNSWYRDANSNKSVGGSPTSRHLRGDAVDFIVDGISPEEVYRQLEAYHGNHGGLGKYSQKGFTHLDLRGKRARWIG